MATITPRGERWFAQVRKGGKSISKTFTLEADARKWARQQEVDIERGKFARPVTLTIDAAVEAYRALREESRREIRKGSTEDYTLKYLAEDLKGVTIEQLTPERLVRWAKRRVHRCARQSAGPATIGMDLSKLGTVLKTVASLNNTTFPDVVGTARPMLHHLGLIGPGGKRDRRPSDQEMADIKSHCGQWMVDCIDLAQIVGLRRGEITSLLWADVDRPRRVILVRDRKDPRQKIGNNQLVPLLGESFEIIMRQPKDGPKIFPYNPVSISKAFLRACRLSGVEDFHFHDLRHEAASNLFETGLSIEQVAVVTGHKTWSQLKRYTNLKPEAVGEAFERLRRVK